MRLLGLSLRGSQASTELDGVSNLWKINVFTISAEPFGKHSAFPKRVFSKEYYFPKYPFVSGTSSIPSSEEVLLSSWSSRTQFIEEELRSLMVGVPVRNSNLDLPA